jgi:hypothetical protein
MQNQPMVGIDQIIFGHSLHEGHLNSQNIFTWSQASSIGHPEDVRIDCHGWVTKRRI